MPLTYNEFKNKRRDQNALFTGHLVPQFDYLERLLRTAAAALSDQGEEHAKRIEGLGKLADAVHLAAHSGESIFNSNAGLEKALRTLDTLPQFLEADEAVNYKLLQETAKAHPELAEGLPPADKRKTVTEHLRDVNSFCALDYGYTLSRHRNEERRERFLDKMHADNGDSFREYTGKQMRFLSSLYQTAAEDLRLNGGDERTITNLTYMGGIVGDIARRGWLYNDDRVIDSRMGSVQDLPESLTANDGATLNILRDTLKRHPELAEHLPQQNAYRNKTLVEHVLDVTTYLEVPVSNAQQAVLDLQHHEIREERREAAKQEEKRRENYEERRHAETVALLQADISQAEDKDLNEQRAEENRRRERYTVPAETVQQRVLQRSQNGAFSLPPQYDNRDAAGMFVESAKHRGPEYTALVQFSRQVGTSIRQYNDFLAPEYTKRMPDAMKDLPEQPTPEERTKAIDDALKAVPADLREQQLRAYYADYDERLAAEQQKLGEEATADDAAVNLYRQSLLEQYHDDLRKKTYGTDKIREAQKEAAAELAKKQLDEADPAVKERFEKEKSLRTGDIIARRIKTQILEGYRKDRNHIVDRYFPTQRTQNDFINAKPARRYLYSLQGEAYQNALYEELLGGFVDDALAGRSMWRQVNELLAGYETPDSLKDPEGQAGPLDMALKTAKEAPAADLAERELLGERGEAIPQAEIDRLAEEKLPLPQSDDELLYGWAREQKQEELKESIRKERDEKFPDVAAAGIDTLRQIHTQTQQIIKACENVLPEEGEDEPALLDYESEIRKDPQVTPAQRKKLRDAYHAELKEKQLEDARKRYPKLMTDEDKKLREQMEQEAVQRQKMTDQQRREEDVKILTRRRDEAVDRYEMHRDMRERQRRADEEKQNRIDEAKNQKIAGRLEGVGDAVAGLRGNLNALANVDFAQGSKLGQAYQKLDHAFTRGDLDRGRELCGKLGVEPEKKPARNKDKTGSDLKNGLAGEAKEGLGVPAQEALQNGRQEPEKDDDDGSELSDESEDMNVSQFTEVENPVFMDADNVQATELTEEEKQKREKEREAILQHAMNRKADRKPYIFEPGFKDPEDEKKQEHPAEEHEGEYSEVDNVGDGDYLDEQERQLTGNIPQLWNSIRTDRHLRKDDLEWRMSTILAVHTMVRKARKHQDPGMIDAGKVEADAEAIRSGAAFKMLFKKDAPNFRSQATADMMIGEWEKNRKIVKAYKQPAEQAGKLSERLAPVAENLRRTYSGKIIKFIPRGPLMNSTAYNDSLAAIRTVRDKQPAPTADDLYTATQTVLRYLDKKETVRKRAFGRVRWNECMTFLKNTMPPQQFKDYCDYINEKRGVLDNPEHADYVSPESFGSTVHKEACDEALDMIKRGKDRPEDYATLIALRYMDPNSPVDKQRLTQEKLRILQDEKFQFLAQEENLPQLKKLVVEDGGKDFIAKADELMNNNGLAPVNRIIAGP